MQLNENPFNAILSRLEALSSRLEELHLKVRNPPERNYTVDEVSKILHLSAQTVRSKIHDGIIEADINTKPFLIPHSSIYDENNQLKKIKYKRKA